VGWRQGSGTASMASGRGATCRVTREGEEAEGMQKLRVMDEVRRQRVRRRAERWRPVTRSTYDAFDDSLDRSMEKPTFDL
jgi:hypothetical protein